MAEIRERRSRKKNHQLWRWLKPVSELSIAGLVIFFLLIAYGILPNRWYHTLFVYSGSMAPLINSGDLIFITPPPPELMPGMIITLNVDGYLVTHRVIGLQADGKMTTKGDANIEADEWGNAKVKLVGLYRARIPYLGYVFGAIQDLLKLNASGAWFVDREILEIHINICSQKAIEAATITATPSATLTPQSSRTPSVTSSPTLTPTIEYTDDEAITSTLTSPPIDTEITPILSLVPTETEAPITPTFTPTVDGADATNTNDHLESTGEVSTDISKQ